MNNPVLKRMLNTSITGVMILLVFAFLPILLILRVIFGDKSNVSKDKVLCYPHRMRSGEIDEYWWDDFLNVPIKHPDLDAIRNRCVEIWHPDSGFLFKDEETGQFQLTQSGHSEIARLICECENVETLDSG